MEWNDHSASLRLDLHPKNRTLHPLMRRALAIDKASFGADHANVARDLNNLAQLLQATNRLSESEPLMRRALYVMLRGLGAEHPNSCTVRCTVRENYVSFLQAMGETEDEIKENIASLLRVPEWRSSLHPVLLPQLLAYSGCASQYNGLH